MDGGMIPINWTRVVLLWNGEDICSRTYENTHERAIEIEEDVVGLILSQVMTGDPYMRMTHPVIVYHAREFDPCELRASLEKMNWEFPEEVEFLWRTKGDEGPYNRMAIGDLP